MKLINSHDYNIYVRKKTIENRKKVVEEIKNENKNGEITLKKYIPKTENGLINNNNEIEVKLRSTAFKYKDKSYYADFDNLVDRKEFDTIEIRKFNGINFDVFVDITKNPIKKNLINDLLMMKGIK